MKILKEWTLVLLITVFTLSGSWVYGQTAPAEEPAKAEKWEFIAVPYFWMSSISGDVTVHGIPTHITIPFNEVFKASTLVDKFTPRPGRESGETSLTSPI